MRAAPRRFANWFFALSRLQYWPVRVRSGVAAGARWTLYPYSAYWRGAHEPSLQQTLLALGDMHGWNCWDLGAHYGVYSIGLARRVGPTGTVAAFEPNPVSFARLQRHCQMNGLSTLKAFQAAVSDQAGSADLLTYGDLRSTTTHLAYENETLGSETKPLGVQTVVLDELVAIGQILPPQFIKVDIEGHAHKALSGAKRTLISHRPILIIAFHCDQEVQGVMALLEPLGYELSIIPTNSGSADAVNGHDVLFKPNPRP